MFACSIYLVTFFGESVVLIKKCGNYFPIKLTVYIYIEPKTVYICKGRKTREEKVPNSFRFQTEKTFGQSSCVVKGHVSVLKVQFPDSYFKLHVSV